MQSLTLQKNAWIFKPLVVFFSYAAWVIFARLLTLTLITYLMISPGSRFQDISEAFSSNEVSLMGLAALSFIAFLFCLRPITSITRSELISRGRIEKDFLPGFLRGGLLATLIVTSFLLLGTHRNLGYLIQFHEAPLELLNILLRIVALVSLAYGEEYLFRQKLVTHFSKYLSPIATSVFVTVLYCLIKVLQFDLGLIQLFTLGLISMALSMRAMREPKVSFAQGAGILAGVLTILHPVLSLPIFGNDFSGILLVKYQALSHPGFAGENQDFFRRLLTGGAGGPLSSLTLQMLLTVDLVRSILRQK